MIPPSSLVAPSPGGGLRLSSTARVERGPSNSLPSLKRSGQAALYCAHRTSTVSSCAFCEQEGHLATPSLPSELARSILSRTVVTAAAGIRALLVSCRSEAPRPVLTGGAACSTFRSTMSRNGTSCCAKRRFATASNRALALAAAARLSSPSL
jgi:hypothetical protein